MQKIWKPPSGVKNIGPHFQEIHYDDAGSSYVTAAHEYSENKESFSIQKVVRTTALASVITSPI